MGTATKKFQVGLLVVGNMAEETFMFAVTAGVFAFLAVILSVTRARRYSQAAENQSPSQFLVGDIRLWIYLPIVLITFLGVILWFPYAEHQRQTSTEEEPRVATVWGYIESETFKAILTVLVIPIFIFLFERRFKILENYEASRKEKILSKIKANREKRLQIISDTINLWDNLYNHTLEVIYYEPSYSDEDNKDKVKEEKVKIRDLSRRIASLPNEGDRVTNLWEHWFPNLSSEERDQMEEYLDYLWHPTLAVVHMLEDDILSNNEGTDIHELQLSLHIIRGKIRATFHDELIHVMTHSNELLMIIEDNMPDQVIITPRSKEKVIELVQKINDKNERQEACHHLSKIQDILKNISKQSKEMREKIDKYRSSPLFNIQETSQVELYRTEYQNVVNWFKTNRSLEEEQSLETLRSQDVWKKFKEARDSIPFIVLLAAFRYPFTRQNIKDYADRLDETGVALDARNEAQQKIDADIKK